MNASFDFTKSFPLSDVLLVAEDAEGSKRELHANRAYLATYSSFFERMFFSNFKEAKSDSIEVSCSYEMMKLILEVIYGNAHSKVKQTYDVDVLMELYKTADYLDIPSIHGLCVDQMLNRPSVEMATGVLGLVTSGLDLHDTLIDILKSMDVDVLQKFLIGDNSHLVFSKDDVATIYEAIAKKPLTNSTSYASWNCTKLPDLYEEYKNPLIDFTKKFPWSDVLIKTKNSEGKELHSCKAILAIVSPHFAEMFSSQPDIAEIEVDVEYIVMKNILAIIHQCYKHDSLHSIVWDHIFMLYVLFRFASEDKLNIPKIRELCTQSMKEVVTRGIVTNVHMELCIRMTGAKNDVLRKISAEWLLVWVFSRGSKADKVYVIENNQYRMHYEDKEKPILSLNDVRIIIEKLLKSYNK